MVDDSDKPGDSNNLINRMVLLANEIIKLTNQKYILTKQEVQEIINNKIHDELRIEHSLDSLLECIVYSKGKKEFQELTKYYRCISPAGADFYDECLTETLRENLVINITKKVYPEDAIPDNQKPGAKAGNPYVDKNLDTIRKFQSGEYYRKQMKILKWDDESNQRRI